MTYSGYEIPLPMTSNRQKDWGSIPGKSKKFSTSSKRQIGSGARPTSWKADNKISLSGVKRPRREADRTPQSRFQVKNEWSYTYNHPRMTSWPAQGRLYSTSSRYPDLLLYPSSLLL
jgi:hypothetical protein